MDSWYDALDQYEALVADPQGYFADRGLVVEERDGKFYVLLRDESGWRITKAEGNWKLAQASQGQDELGTLIRGFNDMARELETNKAEIERRRQEEHPPGCFPRL